MVINNVLTPLHVYQQVMEELELVNRNKKNVQTKRTRKRSHLFLFSGFISLILLLLLIYYFPPDLQLPILNSQISTLYIFLFLLFCFLFSASTYIFASKKHGLLIGLFVPLYLLFRLNNLTHPFFFLLLLALFIVLELLFSYRK